MNSKTLEGKIEIGRLASPARHNYCFVTFSCEAPMAESVRLVGDFNAWDLAATPMRRIANDRWAAALALNCGSYCYQFVVDGIPTLDPHGRTTPGKEQVSQITFS